MVKLLAIVGMGEGIGLAVARRFAQAGFTIAMVARNAGKLQGFQTTLAAEGHTAHSFVGDAGDAASLQSAFESIRKQLGDPAVLVYNAAIPRQRSVLDETVDSLIADFTANVAGALVATQAVLPGMTTQGAGTLLFTGGGFALYPNPEFASLSIGKAGIRSLAKMLAAALAKDSIRVGTVTICGVVNADDPKYSPTQIAEQYWAFHSGQVTDSEIVY